MTRLKLKQQVSSIQRDSKSCDLELISLLGILKRQTLMYGWRISLKQLVIVAGMTLIEQNGSRGFCSVQ